MPGEPDTTPSKNFQIHNESLHHTALDPERDAIQRETGANTELYLIRNDPFFFFLGSSHLWDGKLFPEVRGISHGLG